MKEAWIEEPQTAVYPAKFQPSIGSTGNVSLAEAVLRSKVWL